MFNLDTRPAPKRPVVEAPRPSAAARLRLEVLQAVANDLDLDGMVLHMTLGDMEQLKRDRDIPVADISFAGGEMRYLGVRVVRGAVGASLLRPASEIVDAPVAPAKPARKTPAKRKKAEVEA